MRRGELARTPMTHCVAADVMLVAAESSRAESSRLMLISHNRDQPRRRRQANLCSTHLHLKPPPNGFVSRVTGNAGARVACGEIKLRE